jgi:hypothetical protein
MEVCTGGLSLAVSVGRPAYKQMPAPSGTPPRHQSELAAEGTPGPPGDLELPYGASKATTEACLSALSGGALSMSECSAMYARGTAPLSPLA